MRRKLEAFRAWVLDDGDARSSGGNLSRPRRSGIQCIKRPLRILYFTAREFHRDHCLERAATLAFVTILSLIPLAVLFFSFAETIGANEEIKKFVKARVFPEVAPDFAGELRQMLDKMISTDAFSEGLKGVVGFVALVSLILAALGVVVTAERNFNRVWKVRSHRTFLNRLTTFWIVLTLSPFLIVASGWAGDLLTPNPVALKSSWWLQLFYTFVLPVSIGFVGFTLVYLYLPSTSVRITSAVVGGVMAAALWEFAKFGFTYYSSRTASLYGHLSLVPLFLVWLYINWLNLLWGCELAFVHQHVDSLSSDHEEPADAQELPRSLLALYLLEKTAGVFLNAAPLQPLRDVAAELRVGVAELEDVARALEKKEWIVEAAGSEGAYTLLRPPERVRVRDVLVLFAGPNTLPARLPDGLFPEDDEASRAAGSAAVSLFRAGAREFLSSFGDLTLRELVAVPARAPESSTHRESGHESGVPVEGAPANE